MMVFQNINVIDLSTFEISQTSISCNNTSGKEDEIIDASKLYAFKPFVNAHHHIYSALARGMNAPKIIPSNFLETLQYVWWTLDQCLSEEMIKLSALTTAIACAKNGCTFVVDHHSSPSFLRGSLEIIAEAFDQVGIGHLLCYEITDRYGESKAMEALEETQSYLKNRKGLVGLHASFTIGHNTLTQAIDVAKKNNTGIHIHVAEDHFDQEHCLDKYSCRVIERLFRAGVFDLEKTIFAHCIHIDESERKLLSESTVNIAINVDSNLNNRVGNFRGNSLQNRIMLGTDGMHSNMIKSAQTAFFSGQNFEKIDLADVFQRLQNSRQYAQDMGFCHDDSWVILDYDTPTPITTSNFLGHFFFGLENRHIKYTISEGELLYKDGVILKVDEESILKESRKMASILWGKMGDLHK